jgi:hypothetical protein
MPRPVNDDFSATKGFIFTESINLQFRTDFFNLTQHFNADPNTVNATN